MRWMLNLDGGPRRVNHAACAVGDKIYSFGGYSANEALDSQGDFIDVHALNTFTYRWERLPVFPPDQSDQNNKQRDLLTKQRSVTVSGLGVGGDSENSGPSTSEGGSSSSSTNHRRRARSLSDLHPLARIRAANPPLPDAEADLLVGVLQQRRQSNQLDQSPSLARQQQQQLRRAAAFHPPLNRRQSPQQQRQNNQQAIREEEDEEGVFEEDGELRPNARQQLRELFHRIDADLAEMMSEDESGDSDYVAEDEEEEEMDRSDSMISEDEMDYMDVDDDEDEEYGGHGAMVGIGEEGEEEDDGNGSVIDLPTLAKLHKHPEIPFKRYGHTVVAYKGLIYLWGGRNDKLGCNQTLHCFNPAENRWHIVPTEGQCPPARDGHTAVVDGEQMFIFGGFEEREHRFSQETYAFHFPTRTWSKLKSQGEPPQYRDFHAACVLNGKMYVFGGRSDEMGQLHTSHDVYCDKLHVFDLKIHKWHQPEIKGPAPCGRRSHTMWTYQGAIYLFGGYQSLCNHHFNDLWRFEPDSNKWTLLMPSGHGPSPRRRQCTVLIGTRIFLFGGTMPNSVRKNVLSDLGDLFVLDFAPSLASLCSQAILKHGLQHRARHILPTILSNELFYMSTPNHISKSAMLPPLHDTLTRG